MTQPTSTTPAGPQAPAADGRPPAGARDTSRDGLANRLELWLTTSFPGLWQTVERIEPVRRAVNRTLIDRSILKVPPRPNPLSTRDPYTSWASLTDRTYSGRHLPPKPAAPGLPSPDRVADLFNRDGETILCPKSTVLFPYFAQWFTDGFLRSDRSPERDPRRNESNHEIDLTPLYGVHPEQTDVLRAHEGGLLKSQELEGEEYPPYLCEDGRIKDEFRPLTVVRFDELTDEQKRGLFAMGSDTSNFQLGFVLMNVLFLREHNRLARALARQSPSWDDERLFGTARAILTVLLMKIVIEEYINHIAPYHLRFRVDPGAFEKARWYRTNWMAIEFNLLYRWHSAVPSRLRLPDGERTVPETLFDTDVVIRHGLGPHFDAASRQPAGRIGLRNTDAFLWEAERNSVAQGRTVELASYNDYREHARFPRVTDFDQISGDPRIQEGLRQVYGSVDRIEFYPGLFAEDPRPDSVLPSLIGRLVGIDAFSQALTNPLLARRIHTEATFSLLGMRTIRETRSLADILARNLPPGAPPYLVTMTRTDWQRAS